MRFSFKMMALALTSLPALTKDSRTHGRLSDNFLTQSMLHLLYFQRIGLLYTLIHR
jgi:hypothetical protein